jgi:hypothetical protein
MSSLCFRPSTICAFVCRPSPCSLVICSCWNWKPISLDYRGKILVPNPPRAPGSSSPGSLRAQPAHARSRPAAGFPFWHLRQLVLPRIPRTVLFVFPRPTPPPHPTPPPRRYMFVVVASAGCSEDPRWWPPHPGDRSL